MIYVTSDIHGRYDKYIKLLQAINFSADDSLYIIGDVCDRGPCSAQIYMDVMSRENIQCIMGNHEKMLLEALPYSFAFLQKEFDCCPALEFSVWSACGGGTTCASFLDVGIKNISEIYRFIRALPLYQIVECANKRYLLIHGGLGNYAQSKPLNEYSYDELLWDTLNYDGTYYPTEFDYIIVGHTPTFMLSKNGTSTIFHGKGNVINIDCGAVFSEGNNLGCLCLDTLEEIYA